MKKHIALTVFLLLFIQPLFAQQNPTILPLWTNGAPGFESRRNEPEQAKDWWVKNVHNPSLTVYLPPPGKANGAAVVVCPGGGHRELVFNPEGRDAAVFLNSLGVTVFVLKYRLAREENSAYTLDKHVRQDIYRAMHIVRSRADEWHIDPMRIGIMGFSAGGEVAAMVAYNGDTFDANAADPVERCSAQPNFQILIYPGPLGIPDTIRTNAPPSFLLAANDDACCSEPILKLIQAYRKANVPVEVHLYAQGEHGFNMGNRSKLKTISGWPQRLADWLSDNNYLRSTTK